MVPIHPGRILRRELAARELSANRLALLLRVPSGRISDILNGKRGISPETALRLAPDSCLEKYNPSLLTIRVRGVNLPIVIKTRP